MKPMTKLMLVLVTLGVLAAIPACNNGCAVDDQVAHTAAAGISKALQCSNPGQVVSDVSSFVKAHDFGLCTAKSPGTVSLATRGGIISGICMMVVDAAVANYAMKPVPPAWGCSGQMAGEAIKTAFDLACGLIPVSSPTPIPQPTKAN